MREDDFSLADQTIVIIGLGLMGGSLAMTLKGRCKALYGIDPQPAALELARAEGIVDRADGDPAALLPEADVVILAAPVPAILEWLSVLPRFIPRGCIVLDLGSTKREIALAMEALPEGFDPVGGHPICGREQLGLRNASAEMYREAPFAVTPLARSTSRSMSAMKQIISSAGARALELSPDQHDRILASTSHLPFLISSILALATPPENAPFIGTGFRSVARLAGTPASMMLGVLGSNRDNLLDAVRSFKESLALVESALEAGEDRELESLLVRSRAAYEKLLTPSSA